MEADEALMSELIIRINNRLSLNRFEAGLGRVVKVVGKGL